MPLFPPHSGISAKTNCELGVNGSLIVLQERMKRTYMEVARPSFYTDFKEGGVNERGKNGHFKRKHVGKIGRAHV